jgi:hypothetical protein
MAPKQQQQQPCQPKKMNSSTTAWSNSTGSIFPYPVDYNDHFETPVEAYRDIKPVLDWLTTINNNYNNSRTPNNKTKVSPVLYDPYYCDGRTKLLLHEIGYDTVIHERRDFYADIRHNTIPHYDIFISNPPYSDEHKSKCLEYCQLTQQQQERKKRQRGSDDDNDNDTDQFSFKPYLLLMPAYVATKSYMRLALADLLFLVPSQPYQYHHPDETGYDISPFPSLWFCGIGRNRVDACLQHLAQLSSTTRATRSLAELADWGIIRLQNRLNPKQRQKQRRKLLLLPQAEADTTTPKTAEQQSVAPTRDDKASINEGEDLAGAAANTSSLKKSGNTVSKAADKRKNSKYRDPSGKRQRRRF